MLKHHADHHLKNLDGQEPLDIAVAAADADIVTLLRFSFFNVQNFRTEASHVSGWLRSTRKFGRQT